MSNYTASAQVIQKYLEDLCVKIGERPVGSENNRKAESYIGAVFRQNGYAVEFQEFDCIDWRGGTASLRLGTQPIPAAISPYSLPCNVTAGYELIGDIEHLAQCELRNKIAVLYGSLTREAIMPKNFKFWNPEEHHEGVDNGDRVFALVLPDTSSLAVEFRPDLLNGVAVIKGGGIVAVPYYSWANRGPGQMLVWLPRTPAAVRPPQKVNMNVD